MRRLLGGLGLWLWLLAGTVLAQPPPPSPSPTSEIPLPTPVPAVTPSAVPLEKAQVKLNGLKLLVVGPDSERTAQERAESYSTALQALVDSGISEPPEVKLYSKADGSRILVDNIRISILDTDLAVNGKSRHALEEEWESALRGGLKLAVAERQAGHFARLTKLLLVVSVIFFLLDYASHLWIRRRLGLPGWSARFLLLVSLAAIWLSSFPETRLIGIWLVRHIVAPLWWVVLMLVVGLIVIRTARSSVHQYFRTLERVGANSPSAGPRWQKQMAMYEQLARIAVTFVVGLIVFLVSFAPWNVDWWALITGAGFITAAIGLAAQDLLKDTVAGINIVFEDQFSVGDQIRVPGAEGRVEAFTLRITRIRDVEGSLITIPNSSLRMVTNLSNTWSQVDLKITVGYQTDVRRALQIMDEEARQLLADWPDKVAEPPEVLGLDQLGDSALTVRMTVRTFPMMQFMVRRELLLRLKERFDKEGIEIPYPQRVVWLKQLGGEHVQEADGDVRGRGQGGSG